MIKVEDFKNAPVGATATNETTGNRAMKLGGSRPRWISQNGLYLANKEMENWRYTLDVPARTLPTRDEIADELSGWPIGSGYYQTRVAMDEARDMADAVLELLKGQDR